MEDILKTITLKAIKNGAFTGTEIMADKIFSIDRVRPLLVLVVRRPGCMLCREHALEVSRRVHDRTIGGEVDLVGIVKEVAPTKEGVVTDEELGVGEFQSKYFRNYPCYVDEEQTFFKIVMGNNLFSMKPYTWNPFTLYKDFRNIQQRMKEKEITGNLKGDYAIKGGLLLFSKNGTLQLKVDEVVGEDLPYDVIVKAVKDTLDAEKES
jgi:hypothetical protein